MKDFFHSPTIKVKKEKKRMFRRGGFQRGKVVDAQTVTYCRWHPFNPFNVGNINVCCLYRKSRPYKRFSQRIKTILYCVSTPQERMWHRQVHIILVCVRCFREHFHMLWSSPFISCYCKRISFKIRSNICTYMTQCYLFDQLFLHVQIISVFIILWMEI